MDNQKASKNTFQATTFKVEENSRTFQELAKQFKDFSRKNGIQGVSRTFQDCANPVVHRTVVSLYISDKIIKSPTKQRLLMFSKLLESCFNYTDWRWCLKTPLQHKSFTTFH